MFPARYFTAHICHLGNVRQVRFSSTRLELLIQYRQRIEIRPGTDVGIASYVTKSTFRLLSSAAQLRFKSSMAAPKCLSPPSITRQTSTRMAWS